MSRQYLIGQERKTLLMHGGFFLETVITLVKLIAVFTAAIILGSWFLSEVKKSRLKGEPAYKPYLSFPGIIITMLVLLLPILTWFFTH
jgi:hypothetical protein